MTGRPDEVQARVDSEIGLLTTLWLLLLPHIGFVLVIHKVDDGSPRVTVVDIVTESGSIDDSKLDLEGFFLELRFDDFHLKRQTF
jgi:hypothetical protein